MQYLFDDATAERKSNDIITERINIANRTHRDRASMDNRLAVYGEIAAYGGVA